MKFTNELYSKIILEENLKNLWKNIFQMQTQFKQIKFIKIFIENIYSLHEFAVYSE